MTDSAQLVSDSLQLAPTRTASVLKVRFVQYGRHRRLTIEVAFIHSDLPAEGLGGHVALKEGLILRPECICRFHTVPYL